MDKFESYIREDKAVRETINKFPERYRSFLDDYDIRFEPGNTLRDDPGHVGRVFIGGNNNTITIASPWNYGREFTLLHEIAHLIYDRFVKNTEWERKWKKVYKLEPGPKREGAEESFCHALAQYYVTTKVSKFDLKPWKKFMDEFCR